MQGLLPDKAFVARYDDAGDSNHFIGSLGSEESDAKSYHSSSTLCLPPSALCKGTILVKTLDSLIEAEVIPSNSE